MCIIVHTQINLKNTHLSDKNLAVSLLWDRLGISISTICAIHCLLLPVFVALLPLWSFGVVIHEWLHPLFILLILPTVYYASKRSHFQRKIIRLLFGGLFLLVTGWGLGHFWIGLWFETGMTVIGSLVLIAGHWLNYRHHRVCSNKNHNHHPVEP